MAQKTFPSSAPLPQPEASKSPLSALPQSLRLIAVGVVSLIVLGAFVIFGGVPSDDRTAIFWAATLAMIVILLGFGAATWHLLYRALPAGHRTVAVEGRGLGINARAMLALLMAISSFSLIISTFWDELWHRQFGIPLGEDLLWRPHLMMYFAFLAVVALGSWGLWKVMRDGTGTLQQRFRAQPVLGLAIITGAFLLYVIPADPAWHFIYGDDISAWSIPHLLLVLCFITIMLLSVAFHMTTLARRAWAGFWKLSINDAIPLLMFACIQTIFLQFFTTEYDQGFASTSVVAARPTWMLPLIIVICAAFTGVGAAHTTRRVGAATVSGLIALAIRVGLLAVFDTELLHLKAPVVILPALVAIDLWYAVAPRVFKRPQGSAVAWVGGGLMTVVATIGVTIPFLFPIHYDYLTINDLPVGIVVMLAMSALFAWGAAGIGDYVANSGQAEVAEPASAQARVKAWVPLVSFGALMANIAFVVVFIITAAPPI
jgi:hypothetical protein